MTIRRRESQNQGIDGGEDDEESPVRSDSSSEEDDVDTTASRRRSRRQLGLNPEAEQAGEKHSHPRELHPASTEFSPSSLTVFLRSRIPQQQKTRQSQLVAGKGKGKAKAEHTTNSQNDSLLRHLLHSSESDEALPLKDTLNTGLTLAPNALAHLHGQTGLPTTNLQPQKVNLLKNVFKNDADPHSSAQVASKPKRKIMKRRATGRANDENSTPTQDDSDSSPPRHRKTNEQLSHLVPSRQSTPDTILQKPGQQEPQTHSIQEQTPADPFLQLPNDAEDSLDLLPFSNFDDAAVISDSGPQSRLSRVEPQREFLSSENGLPSEVDPTSRAAILYQRGKAAGFKATKAVLFNEVRDRAALIRESSRRGTKKPCFDFESVVPASVSNYDTTFDHHEFTGGVVDQFQKTHNNRLHGNRQPANPFKLNASAKSPGRRPQPTSTDHEAKLYEFKLPHMMHYPLPEAPQHHTESLTGLNFDIWDSITDHLSFEDVCRLRLVCKDLSNELSSILFRNVVVKFGKSMFGKSVFGDTMFERYGKDIHKFGVSFEYDSDGLASATCKTTEKRQDAWYGSYRWPVEKYPRFSKLQQLEDLVDNNDLLLRNSMSHLKQVNELALSLDSGHGWLEGADISDLALFERRRMKGTKIFGQTFDTEDVWHRHGRNEYFKWAQQNAINKSLARNTKTEKPKVFEKDENSHLKRLIVRDYESFEDEVTQPDFDPHSHTGGGPIDNQTDLGQLQGILNVAGIGPFGPQFAAPVNQMQMGQMGQFANALAFAHHNYQQIVPPIGPLPAPPRRRTQNSGDREMRKNSGATKPVSLQWPIIFNGHSIAAEVSKGWSACQSHIADPNIFGYVPGHLTEAQVQWLMETLWAQKAFLAAYTTSVITHKQNLRQVHTLTLAKVSSGLLPSLAQREFWTSLPSLKRLKILISPDWREEHVPGDRFFAASMPVSPVTAAGKFANFLRHNIARLENLSHLTIGYVGGGEHAVGLFARNQHLLPAPIEEDPLLWLTDHVRKPNKNALLKFDHIRDLTFENCWFSPCMLEAFMENSRDTSLHTLTLDSVSMLSRHSTGTDGPLSTVRNSLKTAHAPEDWLHEELPASACWTEVLDRITPGLTMEERKYRAGMIDAETQPPRAKGFRGNTQKIVLKSCGYARIGGITGEKFNQNSLVVQIVSPQDTGLATRRTKFERHGYKLLRDSERANQSELHRHKMRIMMSMFDPVTEKEYLGLGTLTQCVHPIEKRVLEQAWGMRFGWGNDVGRWAAVEDGCYEGGTGRFSGVIERN